MNPEKTKLLCCSEALIRRRKTQLTSPLRFGRTVDAMTFRIRNGDVEIHWSLILLSLIPFNQTLTTISSVELFRQCSSVVEARLLSFWEVRNFKRGGELMIDVNFDLKDNVLVILTGWWFGIDMRSTAKMDETGIKVSGWNYKSAGEVERKQKCKKKGIPIKNLMAQRRRKRRSKQLLFYLRNDCLIIYLSLLTYVVDLDIEHQYLKMQIVISTNDYRGSINFTTNLSQLDLDLRLQLPKLPLPSINTYNSYSFFSYQGTFSMHFCYSQVEVRLSAVNTRMICCRRPGLLLATRKALDKLGFGCHKAVISCFDGWDSYKNFVVLYFVVCEYQQYQGHEILLDSIKAVLSYTVGYAVIFSKEMQKMVRSYDLSN
ncbi:hypothetical protein HID58_072159 [Brassica napus]|uniref:Uncharacterized protein n=1 Tax=Brassica napus TaxID=3708 RepID=A0ABQ7Z3K1_BRANA|nr:hypothetical protein HID58_072159 [Brassica napus]